MLTFLTICAAISGMCFFAGVNRHSSGDCDKDVERESYLQLQQSLTPLGVLLLRLPLALTIGMFIRGLSFPEFISRLLFKPE